MSDAVSGTAVGTKPINLAQLEAEINTAGVVTGGLGMFRDVSGNGVVYRYDAEGQAADFDAADQATVEQAVAAHVGLRPKTDAELAAEFQATTDPARKQEIRDMQSGLMPREQVPM